MSTFVRKNLIVDAEAVAALALARGTSESEAVRDAVAEALAAEQTVQALEVLHQVGAFADTPRTRKLYGSIPAIDPQTLRVRSVEVKPRRSPRSQPPATRAS